MGKVTGQPFSEIAAVEPTQAGDTTEGLDRVQAFLARFGYVSGTVARSTTLDDATTEALRSYQQFFGLDETGNFDEATKEHMLQDRCAMPDLFNGVAFATTCAWDRWSLTVTMDTGTADCMGEFQAVRNALRTWESAVPLTFTEVAAGGAADINVGWRPANDPDLNMVGGTLAHADFPPGCSVVTNTLPKPVHFDDTEHAWSIGAVSGAFDVETVALHEFGHIIGLAHSSVAGAVMLPTVSANSTKRALTADDTNGATGLYPSQDNWRWCRKCQGLAFGGGAANSSCPAGGAHDHSGSGDYVLAHGLPATASWQAEWRWCNQCQGLFFGPGFASSGCPAGGTHADPGQSGSGNYSLQHNASAAARLQSNWRWCNRCQGLFFGGNVTYPDCPNGGAHDGSTSGNYSLVHR
jgi:hypothetical protein